MQERGGGQVVWQRLEATLAAKQAKAAETGDSAASRDPKIFDWPIPWAAVDAAAAASWAYALIRVFVGDVDEAFTQTIAPALLPLLDYRLLFFVALLVVAAITLRRWALFYIGYIALFPLVVVFWKLPRFYLRHKSWPLLLGTLQGASAVLTDFKYNLVTKGLGFIASVLILTTDVWWLILPSALYVLGLLIWSLWRRVRRTFNAPTFIEVQRRTIRGLRSERFESAFIHLDDNFTDPVGPYTTEEAGTVEMRITVGIGINKLLLLWAQQLDRYRRKYSPAVVFTLLTYVWVVFASVLGLTLLNLALMKLSPDEYEVVGPRPPIAVLAYAVSTLGMGAAGGIDPVGQLALLLQVGGLATSIVVIAGVLTSLALVARERSETETQELVKELRAEAEAQGLRFRDYYAITVDEAYDKLKSFEAFALRFISTIVDAMPDDGDSPPSPSTSA